ncbi:PEBP-like protein [Tothia fuscella]|uniref:PEBP-like protein n=1 Tax=Tothia fuscella TaxID=1048955 RepID=A0A9P4NNT5_9PEZI|nr:PEBP-like protein [Tothia fuscella]
MIASKVFFLCLQALLVVAQTPAGFAPAATEPLKVTFAANEVSPAGKQIQRTDTANTPTLNIPKSLISPTTKGLLILIDPDVNILGSKVNYLHWLIPNIDLSTEKLTIPTTGSNIVKYFQPSPPMGDPPHRYTFLLYVQPATFTIPAQYANLQSRVLSFDVKAFAGATGLGEPKAGSYMLVQR